MKTYIRRRLNSDIIVQDFKKIHGNIYNYSLVDYKTMHTKVKIICSKHGEFEQTPNAHIRQKQGCPICGIEKNHYKQTDTTESFITKGKNIHGNRYLYDKTTYGKNAHEKVIITCRIHGDFLISPNSFLSRGCGCPKCGKITGIRKLSSNSNLGWSRSNWIKRLKGKSATLYILKCWNEEEFFYKIGITGRTVKDRYRGTKSLPYKYEVVHIVESTDIGYIYDLENKLLQDSKDFKYIPKKPFVGSLQECRTQIKL